jgi:hypothetical protein
MRFVVSMGLAQAALFAPFDHAEVSAWSKFTNKMIKPVYVVATDLPQSPLVDGTAQAGTQEIQLGYLGAKTPTGTTQNEDLMGESDSISLTDPMSDDIAPPISPAQTHVPPQAMQASPHPVVVIQPDGSKVVLRIQGGPTLNWQTDLNGYPVVKSADGRYVYAIVDLKGQLKATDRVVGKVDPAAAGIRKDRPTAPTAGGKPPASDPMRKVETQPADPMGDLPTTSPAQSKKTLEQPADPMGDLPTTSPAQSKKTSEQPADPMGDLPTTSPAQSK